MTVSITDIRPAARDEWDSTWQGCSYSTYFHSREWAEIWQIYTKGRMRPAPLLVTFSDGARAVLPLSLEISHRGILKSYVSSPAGTFGGWLSTDELGSDHAVLLADYLITTLRNLCWRLNPYDPLVHQVGIKTSAFDQTQACNLELGFDEFYRHTKPDQRRSERKAQAYGVTVQPASSLAEWRGYYTAYLDSLRRWGDKVSSRYDWCIFEEMFRRNSPYIRLWLAMFQGSVVAGTLCFYARKHVVTWHSAVLQSHFHLRPVNRLYFAVIRDACERGYSWYDFNPSGGHQGVVEFKSRFGSQNLPAPVVSQSSKISRLVVRMSKVVRRLRTLNSLDIGRQRQRTPA